MHMLTYVTKSEDWSLTITYSVQCLSAFSPQTVLSVSSQKVLESWFNGNNKFMTIVRL